ncbi:MAG TPA: AsmA family protein [Thioploca sp.]|nr:AsmA family protein [Thioploca sp.]
MRNNILQILANIIATLFIAVFLFILEFDPNDYKQQLTELIKNQTGRILKIEGNIALTLYPQISLDIDEISFSDYLAESKFVTINKLKLTIKLLPLLYQHIEIESFFLDKLNLVQTLDSNNWDDLLKQETTTEKSSFSIVVNNIKINNANLSINDQGKLYTISQANFTISTINSVKIIKFNSSFTGINKFNGQVELNSNLIIDEPHYKFISLFLSIQSDTIPASKILFKIPQIDLNITEQVLNINQLIGQILGLKLNGQLQINQLFSKPIATGQIKLTSANLRKLVKHFQPDLELPTIPKLQKVKLTSGLQYVTDNITLNNFQLTIDDNRFQTPQINLTKQTIDLPEFLLQVLGINIDGKLTLTKIFDQPVLQGKLLVNPFNLQQLLKTLNQPVIQELPGLPMNKVSLQTELNITTTKFMFKQVQVKVDDNEFTSGQIDFIDDKLKINSFIIKLLGITTRGYLSISQHSQQIQGYLQVEKFNPRNLFSRLAQQIPNTADPTVLQALRLTTNLQGDLSNLNLKNMKITLDDSKLQGNINLAEKITFQFEIDDIDINRYLLSSMDKNQDNSSNDPIKMLKTLDINGILKFKSLKIIGMEIKDIHFKVITGENGKIRIYPKFFNK